MILDRKNLVFQVVRSIFIDLLFLSKFDQIVKLIALRLIFQCLTKCGSASILNLHDKRVYPKKHKLFIAQELSAFELFFELSSIRRLKDCLNFCIRVV